MGNIENYTTEKIKEMIFNKINSDIEIKNIWRVFPVKEMEKFLEEINTKLGKGDIEKIEKIRENEKKIKIMISSGISSQNKDYLKLKDEQKLLFEEILPKLNKLESLKEYKNKINYLLKHGAIFKESQNSFESNLFYNIKEDVITSVGYYDPVYSKTIQKQDVLIAEIFSKWNILKGNIYNPGAGDRFTQLFEPKNVKKLIVQDTSMNKLKLGAKKIKEIYGLEENELKDKLILNNQDISENTPTISANCIVFSSLLPIFHQKMKENLISKENYSKIIDKMIGVLDEKGVILESGDIQPGSFEDEYLMNNGFARIELPPFKEILYGNTFNSMYVRKQYQPKAQEKINKMTTIFNEALPKKGPLGNLRTKLQ